MKMILSIFFSITIFLSACTSKEEAIDSNTDELATVVSVVSSGSENGYSFSVGISSPDTGCSQYADWWEVITEEGTLVYRRILDHSHVNEQPFVRSGGTIDITSTQIVIIRAHMNTTGYGILAFKGSVEAGFKATTLDEDYLQNLANEVPLPTGCAF